MVRKSELGILKKYALTGWPFGMSPSSQICVFDELCADVPYPSVDVRYAPIVFLIIPAGISASFHIAFRAMTAFACNEFVGR